MKFFVAILTSSDEELCKLTYDTIINQEPHNLDFDIFIIVNSKNKEYYSKIVEKFKNVDKPVNILETESNGYPGKGHNSVLHTFQDKSKYDYCILIDSGDFFYPTAFNNISMYLSYKPDILFLSYHDNLSTNISQNNIPHFGIENKCFFNYNIDIVTSKIWYESKGINPFHNNINTLNTPARPLLFSKKVLEYDILYDENMKLYDDYIVFIKCFELCVLQKINMYLLVDSAIYLYNTLSTNSATYIYSNVENNRNDENKNFISTIKNKYLAIRDWDLKKIPKLSLGQFNDPGELIKKIKFVIYIVQKIQLPRIYEKNTNNIELIIKYAKENKYQYLLEDLVTIYNNNYKQIIR
jgi:hypothetical protein